MLKLSFNIKNIQNPLQRHLRGGQTILSFEPNLIEDTYKIKKKVFVKAIEIIVERIWVKLYCSLIKRLALIKRQNSYFVF